MKKFKNRQFSLYLTGLVVSTIGDVIYELAISYWVLETTGSKSLMSLSLSIGMFVRMLLLPVAGAVGDSLNKKWIMVSMDAVRGVLMITMGLICMAGYLSVPIVLFSVVISSLAETIFSPSATTLILDILEKNDIIQGQSLQNTLLSIVNVISNGLAGSVVLLFGTGPSMILNGISFAISAVSEVFIQIPDKEKKTLSFKSIFDSVMGGGKVILDDVQIRNFFSVSFMMNLCSAGLMALLLPYVLELGFTVSQYSIISALISVGGILGGVYLSFYHIPDEKRMKVMVLCFISGLITELLAFQMKSLYGTGILILLSMVMSTVANGIFGGLFMMFLPEDQSGTVYSFMASAGSLGSAVSTLVYGVLADHFSISFIAMAGCLLTVLPVLFLKKQTI